MKFSCTALLALALFSIADLSGQSRPDKLSSFSYGNQNRDFIQGVYAVDDRLFASFYQHSGEDGVGQLSVLDPATGAATALLPQEQTSWTGGTFFPGQTTVFSAGGLTFGLQRNLSYQTDLYQLPIDGAPVRLHTAPRDVYSNFVVLDGVTYFLTSSLLASRFSSVLELWRTDGTSAGTRLVTVLPTAYGRKGAFLVAGSSSLLISNLNLRSSEIYRYQPATDDLTQVTSGGSPLEPVLNRTSVFSSPAAYHDGFFWVTGSAFTDQAAYRIAEADGTVVPVAPPPRAGFEAYDQTEFVGVGNDFYLLATRDLLGPDLFRLGADNASLLPIQVATEEAGSNDRAAFPPVVRAGVLYFLSQQEGNLVGVYRLRPGLNTPDLIATLPVNSQVATLAVSEDYLYVSDRDEQKLYRVRTAGGNITATDLRETFPDQDRVLSPLTLFNGDAYYVSAAVAETPSGLYVWRNGSENPERLGNYETAESLTRMQIETHDPASGQLLLRFANLERLLYNSSTGAFLPLMYPGNQTFIRFADISEPTAGVQPYFFVNNADRQTRLLYLDGTEFRDVILNNPPDGVDPNNYSLIYEATLPDGQLLLRYESPADGSTRYFVGSGTAALLDLTEIPGALNSVVTGGTHYETVVNSGTDSREYAVFTAAGVELARYFSLFSRLLAVTAEGFYTTELDVVNRQTNYYYRSYGATDQPVALSLGEAIATPVADPLLVNDRLIVMADSRSFGREWMVADPATARFELLRDINPGAAFGTTPWEVVRTPEAVYFAGQTPAGGVELWRTDGTPEGTVQAADINSGPAYANPANFIFNDSLLFFSANGPRGYELYRHRLPAGPTELVVDLYPGEGDGHPDQFTVLDGKLFFTGFGGPDSFNELYSIDLELVSPTADLTLVPAVVYPNPVGEGPLTVEAPTGERFERLEIFSGAGQLLRQSAASGERAQLHLTGLPAGNYWLRSWYASGQFSLNAVVRGK